ncbi:MAG: hypothetical protein KAU26_05810 [Methylococcales bacterium]|nr:hypothetical protein [Methylococcales bacterium]
MTDKNPLDSISGNVTLAWCFIGFLCGLQITYLVMAIFMPDMIQTNAVLDRQMESTRTIFYVIAIITFPLANIIRHIQRRLIQTVVKAKSLQTRYVCLIITAQTLMASLGFYGFMLFRTGDTINNLYIFSGLAFLGFFLHRPKESEYQALKVHYNDG